MISVEAERNALRQLAVQRLGIDGTYQRATAGSVEGLISAASILSWSYYLGESFGEGNPLQDADGNLLFVWGASIWGGSDQFG